MYQGTELAPQVAEGFTVRDEVYKEVTAEMQEANRNAVSPKGFELAARRIGGLMKSRFNLGFVDVGGWDTHVNEGGASGYLAGRLGELGHGLAGFAEAIGPAWNETVVVVISEFGRTFRENGDRGTDHGHGSVYWVMGGGLKGGRLVGEQVKVEQKSLFQNRDLPGAQRIPRGPGRPVSRHLWAAGRSAGEGVPVGAAEGSGAGVSRPVARVARDLRGRLHAHRGKVGEAERERCRFRYIQAAAFHIGSTIRDHEDHGFAIAHIGHLHP